MKVRGKVFMNKTNKQMSIVLSKKELGKKKVNYLKCKKDILLEI